LSLTFNYEKAKYSQVTKAVVQRVKASQMAGKEFEEQLYIEEQ
jgi:hypothetical protein